MSIQKKSLISTLKTTKKANVIKGSPSFDASVTSGKRSPVKMKALPSQKSAAVKYLAKK